MKKMQIIEGINYELDELTGTAKVVKSEEKYTGDITIPSTVTDGNFKKYKVTSIGNYAFEESVFSDCEGLTSIIIPDSITSIDEGAFCWCKGLISVIIPDSVISIGKYAFFGCKRLASIDIPDGVTVIGKSAFYGCDGLTTIKIPDSLTSIEKLTFYGCKGHTSVKIPNNVSSIEKSAFWVDEYGVLFSADKTILFEAPKGLKEYIIPDGTKVIGQYAFSDTSETLECVLFPDSVEIIENYAFLPAGGQWKKMDSIEIPNSVNIIGKDAFRNIEKLKYNGNASGYPWGAKFVKDNKPHYVRCWVDPKRLGLVYTGEMLNGKPHGKGGYYDLRGTPREEGTYYYGKLVNGDRWTSRGERYSPSGDTWNGYGTGVDSEGNVYTGKWIFGHTEEEFDELWHEIN